jgi:hypothetical protein
MIGDVEILDLQGLVLQSECFANLTSTAIQGRPCVQLQCQGMVEVTPRSLKFLCVELQYSRSPWHPWRCWDELRKESAIHTEQNLHAALLYVLHVVCQLEFWSVAEENQDLNTRCIAARLYIKWPYQSV